MSEKERGGRIRENPVFYCRRLVAEQCLFGVDLDPRAAAFARISLGLFIGCRKEPYGPLKARLRTGDALFGFWGDTAGGAMNWESADARARRLYSGGEGGALKKEGAPGAAHSLGPADGPDFFHWALAFPEVFHGEGEAPSKKRGFSAVIGNPPYGDLLSGGAKEALSRFGYPRTGGRAEISTLFILQGLNLLESGGRLCFIVPNTFMRGRQFTALRRRITQSARVESIVDYRRDRVFPDAEVYSMVLHLCKAPCAAAAYEAVYRRPRPGSTEAPSERLRIHPSSDEPWRMIDPLVERLEAQAVLERLSPGIAECRDGGLDYKYRAAGWSQRGRRPSLGNLLVYSGKRRHPGDKPFIRGGDIVPFGIRAEERYLVHDWRKYRSREAAVIAYPELMEVPVKILTRQTSDRLVAAIDRDRRYTAKSVHTLLVRNGDYTPEFICALLNSPIMNRIYMESTGDEGRTFAQVKVSDLRMLPIRSVGSHTSGRAHPEWIRSRERVSEWILEGAAAPLLTFAKTLLPLPDRHSRKEREENSGIIQVLVTEIVRRIEHSKAEAGERDSAGEALGSVLDFLFSSLYTATPPHVSCCIPRPIP